MTTNRVHLALKHLVDLKDGPRNEIYYATKAAAWQEARDALAEAPEPMALSAWNLATPPCICEGDPFDTRNRDPDCPACNPRHEDTCDGGILPCPECNDSGEFCPACTIIG